MADFGSIRFLANRPLLNEISADRLNSILQEIKRNKPLPGRGITLRQEGLGVRVDLAASVSGSSSTPATTQPWDLVARIDPDASPENPNPPYLVRVRPGTLSEFLPTNWDEEFTLQSHQDYYAVAEVLTDGKAITSVEIKFSTSPPESQQPELFAVPSIVNVVFGIFSQGVALRTIAAGNITLSPKIWFQEARTNVEPGESLYNLYYVLAP
jgi:hypothetical protein